MSCSGVTNTARLLLLGSGASRTVRNPNATVSASQEIPGTEGRRKSQVGRAVDPFNGIFWHRGRDSHPRCLIALSLRINEDLHPRSQGTPEWACCSKCKELLLNPVEEDFNVSVQGFHNNTALGVYPQWFGYQDKISAAVLYFISFGDVSVCT